MSFKKCNILCKNAILLIAACATFHWARGQNTPLIPPVEQCIPANSFAELPRALAGAQTDAYGKTATALGSYERISPDGRFVLRSFSGGRLGDVSLIELGATGQAVAAYDTPLSNEAFPVQGSWRYVVDVNGDHYTLASLLHQSAAKGGAKTPIKPVFRGGMTGFYAAAAELPAALPVEPPAALAGAPAGGGPANRVRIRSMSWPNASGDSERQGEGALVARTLEIDPLTHRVVADSGNVGLCTQRVREDGPLYALPMISVDGTEFAALPQNPVQGEPTMRIFGFGPEGTACTPRAAFGFSSGKTIFGFPDAGGVADLAYEYRGQVWWVQRSSGVRRFNLAPYYDNPRTELLASAFPGITRDGRVIYGATLKDCPANPALPCQLKVGYVTSDPYQSNDYQQFLQQHRGTARRQCITHGDVARERTAFAKLHGLPH
jgi:hypothetical protein